jgi:anaerobic ribonucleoside-triphosphate reductase activating protein
MSQVLNIYNICENGTRVLGPGLRYAIWVQGCLFNCRACTTPVGKPLTPNKLVEVNKLAENILRKKNIQGITISGGEPFLQASKLTALLKIIRANKPELTVITYTGFNYDDLTWDEATELLKYVDLLIDGKYIEELNDGIGIRGSSNQCYHYLTDRLIPFSEQMEKCKRNMEIHIDFNTDELCKIGVPNNITNI